MPAHTTCSQRIASEERSTLGAALSGQITRGGGKCPEHMRMLGAVTAHAASCTPAIGSLYVGRPVCRDICALLSGTA